MATITFIDPAPFSARFKESNYPVVMVREKNTSTITFIDPAPFNARFKESDYPVVMVREKNIFKSKVTQNLPFRIRFTSIGVPGYGPTGFPGIGIQVIGYNNYII